MSVHSAFIFVFSLSQEMGPSVGEVEVAFQYSGENRRMNITIIQCHNLPPKDKGGAGSYRLRLVLNPAKRQRAKTRIRDGDKPEFKELFRFSRIYPHELVSSSIRIRLYGAERMRKERLIGEGIVKFSALNVSKKQVIRLRLKPQSELVMGAIHHCVLKNLRIFRSIFPNTLS